MYPDGFGVESMGDRDPCPQTSLLDQQRGWIRIVEDEDEGNARGEGSRGILVCRVVWRNVGL